MKNIPFLNGGLFENLDKNVGEENEIRIDCISNRIDKEELLKVPDFLFFGEEKQVDLNKNLRYEMQKLQSARLDRHSEIL